MGCIVCWNIIYYKYTKDKNARYIREGSCLKAVPLTKNLKAREGSIEAWLSGHWCLSPAKKYSFIFEVDYKGWKGR